jgi:hypothetical protein
MPALGVVVSKALRGCSVYAVDRLRIAEMQQEENLPRLRLRGC